MKTIEEIKNHVLNNGYTMEDSLRISGYITGIGLKSHKESVVFKIGTGDFHSFMKWFNKIPIPVHEKSNSYTNYFSSNTLQYNNCKVIENKEEIRKNLYETLKNVVNSLYELENERC